MPDAGDQEKDLGCREISAEISLLPNFPAGKTGNRKLGTKGKLGPRGSGVSSCVFRVLGFTS
jgi:hypothetical protein